MRCMRSPRRSGIGARHVLRRAGRLRARSILLALVVVRRGSRRSVLRSAAASAFGRGDFRQLQRAHRRAMLHCTRRRPFSSRFDVARGRRRHAGGVCGTGPTLAAGLLVGLLCVVAAMGNPAHTILGFTFLAALFVVDGATSGIWKVRVALGGRRWSSERWPTCGYRRSPRCSCTKAA